VRSVRGKRPLSIDQHTNVSVPKDKDFRCWNYTSLFLDVEELCFTVYFEYHYNDSSYIPRIVGRPLRRIRSWTLTKPTYCVPCVNNMTILISALLCLLGNNSRPHYTALPIITIRVRVTVILFDKSVNRYGNNFEN